MRYVGLPEPRMTMLLEDASNFDRWDPWRMLVHVDVYVPTEVGNIVSAYVPTTPAIDGAVTELAQVELPSNVLFFRVTRFTCNVQLNNPTTIMKRYGAFVSSIHEKLDGLDVDTPDFEARAGEFFDLFREGLAKVNKAHMDSVGGK